ncbi:DegT/DnrJ/EryC1/StrS family aminotransferase [Streptomyces sp. NPDC001380]|uniref:DegT/DnrJ/EryC1/StrS family aminotransferase n=1 Tax=Streptomyces sp. NPDC001380 TaxID=3364566 RepID=UPI0036959F0D
MRGRNEETIPAARPVIGEDEIEAAVRVLRGGAVVQGPEVAAFEAEFSALVEGRHCVAVNSGTSALQLTLLALGIGPGDEVVVPSFSFAATANAVRLVGAEPVFADIEPGSFCLDPDAAAAAVGPRTAAIMPVHLYGHPAAMDRLVPLAERHGLALVEDAAQAHAAALGGRPVGTFGAAGCFSFYPTKNMHSLEGGMVTTADEQLARTLRLLRNQGMEQRYANEIVGANMRLTDVAAAVGRVQLGRLAGWTEQRRANAKLFDSRLTGLRTPPVADGAHHVYHQYTVRVPGNGRPDRDCLQKALAARGVGSAVYYPTPIHRLKAYCGDGGEQAARWDLPETERASAEVLSLPVYPTLTPAELERVVAAANALGGLL